MAGDRSPGGHGKLSETYSIDLMSKKIYDGMENDSQDLSEYNGKCNDIVVPSNKEEVKTLCKKVLRYLEKSPVWSVQESVYDTCLLLNFWIYDKLTQIFFNKEKKDIAFGNFQTLLKNHSENQKNISADKKCTDKFHILNKVDWKHRKELYDYYIDFNTIKPMIQFYGSECKNYYKYVEGKKHLYEYFDSKCKYKPKECPHFYEQCKNYNPDVVLRNFPCHVQIEAAKNALNTEETSDQGLPDGPRPHGFDLSRHEASSSEAGMTQENSDIGTKVGRSVLGVAPIALTASALYKFTPLGPWIRKISGSSHNITSNGFGDEEQESVNMFFDGGENYISYQPI
ncbi:PIR protein [Plasmodium ovale]|uniref:PIR Superfamily Protein n=2 Tax=Plasmodium ovale TaxID=36330 RepID=A0A1A8X5G3_PLAOA|nr:PIR Superfamily Protein [Plasmodium ovale curtisi]SBT83222.1 PIR protein [Plasmodium ovale]